MLDFFFFFRGGCCMISNDSSFRRTRNVRKYIRDVDPHATSKIHNQFELNISTSMSWRKGRVEGVVLR